MKKKLPAFWESKNQSWSSFVDIYDVVFKLVVGGVLVPIARMLWTIKTNHLQHIDQKLEKIDSKLDSHINWHLDHVVSFKKRDTE